MDDFFDLPSLNVIWGLVNSSRNAFYSYFASYHVRNRTETVFREKRYEMGPYDRADYNLTVEEGRGMGW
jgi:hypothetical protein